MIPAIATRGGRLIDLMTPNPEDFDLNDIAMGLGRAMRWGNQSDMSVAQHSVNVALVVEALGGDKRAQRTGLFHDASEFLIADIPRPMKQLLPEYYSVENNIMLAIATKFDFDWPCPKIIKQADEMMLVTEARALMHKNIIPALVPEYGFPPNLDDFTVPKGRWVDTPLDRDDAAALWLGHEHRLR